MLGTPSTQIWGKNRKKSSTRGAQGPPFFSIIPRSVLSGVKDLLGTLPMILMTIQVQTFKIGWRWTHVHHFFLSLFLVFFMCWLAQTILGHFQKTPPACSRAGPPYAHLQGKSLEAGGSDSLKNAIHNQSKFGLLQLPVSSLTAVIVTNCVGLIVRGAESPNCRRCRRQLLVRDWMDGESFAPGEVLEWNNLVFVPGYICKIIWLCVHFSLQIIHSQKSLSSEM